MVVACATPKTESPSVAAPDLLVERTQGTVDSAIPRDEAMRRFFAGRPAPADLSSGAPSRDSLVARLARALSRHDTAGVMATALTREEWGALYFPVAGRTDLPSGFGPGWSWSIVGAEKVQGGHRLLRELGGRPVRGTLVCDDDPVGRDTAGVSLFGPCSLAMARDTIVVAHQVMRRDGKWKFVAFSRESRVARSERDPRTGRRRAVAVDEDRR